MGFLDLSGLQTFWSNLKEKGSQFIKVRGTDTLDEKFEMLESGDEVVGMAKIADNLVSIDSHNMYGKFVVRTTAGNASIPSSSSASTSEGYVSFIQGNCVHTGYVAETLYLTQNAASEYKPATELEPASGIQVGWIAASEEGEEPVIESGTETWRNLDLPDGTYTFTCNNNADWVMNSQVVQLATYGIEITKGNAAAGYELYVEWAKEQLGTITPGKMSDIISTNENLYQATGQKVRCPGAYNIEKKGTDYAGYVIKGGNFSNLTHVLKFNSDDGTISNLVVPVGDDGYFTIMQDSTPVTLDGTITITPELTGEVMCYLLWTDWSRTEEYMGVYAVDQVHIYPLDAFKHTVGENTEYWLCSCKDYKDEIALDACTYTKRVDVVAYTGKAQIKELTEQGKIFDYDNSYVYIVDTSAVPVGFSIPSAQQTYYKNHYHVYDHGLEEFIGTIVPLWSQTLYGSDMKDNIRQVLMLKDNTGDYWGNLQANGLGNVAGLIYTVVG